MPKVFREFGTGAFYQHPSLEFAKSAVYQKDDGTWPPTPLIFPDNPFNEDILEAETIFDYGAGCGRNYPWVRDNTKARYVGLEPNATMRDWFWHQNKLEANIEMWENLSELERFNTLKFDVVICTFVFQHLGYKFTDDTDTMNLTDITKSIQRMCNPGAVWIMYEDEREGSWIQRWKYECDITFDVFKPDYLWQPDLADRGPHHLMIWRTSE